MVCRRLFIRRRTPTRYRSVGSVDGADGAGSTSAIMGLSPRKRVIKKLLVFLSFIGVCADRRSRPAGSGFFVKNKLSAELSELLLTEVFAHPAFKSSFIFEVKFKDHFPVWLRPIIGQLGLIKRSASKYVFCIDSHHLTDPSQKAEMFRMMHWNSL